MTKLELARRLRDDPRFYLERLLWVKTKPPEEKLVRLILRPIQREHLRSIGERRKRGEPIRDVILKARQVGFSTLAEGLIFQDCSTHKNADSLILCYDEDTTNLLFEKSRLFYDLLPDPVKPLKRYSNRRELVFENPDEATRADMPGLRSSIRVALARNYRAGRSRTLKHVHLSDAAFYEHLRALLSSLLPAIPQSPDTSVFVESSPRVMGDEFYQLYQSAKQTGSGFRAFFYPWFRDPGYRLPFPSEDERHAFRRSLTDEEKEIATLYGLDDEQMYWRHETASEYDSVSEFLSQYPENDIDCFLTAGRTVFKKDRLREMYRRTESDKPKWVGDLVITPEGAIKFVPDPNGPLRIWKLPEPGRVYAVGGDVAEGLATGDFSAAEVLDVKGLEQVAEWHGHTDPDLFGRVLYALGWYYNEAHVGPEVNNHGLVTVTHLLKAGYRRLFQREVPKADNPYEMELKYGWRTDARTKNQMEDDFKPLIREGTVTVHSHEAAGELLSYVVHEDGSTGAATSCYDDRAIALMIAYQVAKGLRNYDPERAEARRAERRRLLNQFTR